MTDDVFRAVDLTDEHLGLYVRTRTDAGELSALYRIDDAFVQLLLVDDDGPIVVVVGQGEPVDLDHP